MGVWNALALFLELKEHLLADLLHIVTTVRV